MKRLTAIVVAVFVLAVCAVSVLAQGEYSVFRTGQRVDVSKELNLAGTGVLKIGGTAVNASAAELNLLDGVTSLGTGTNALAPAYIWVGNATSNQAAVAVSGDVTIATNGAVTIAANAVEESMLKAVDSASDEDFLSYESTTGDFEWHSAAEIAAKFTTGTLTTNVIVDASYTNTIVTRTLASGVIIVNSWTQDAVP